MPIRRQMFAVSSDTGTATTYVDSGPAFFGSIHMVRWDADIPDTGGDLQIFLQQNLTDTGTGVAVVNDNDCMGASFTRAYRMPVRDLSGDIDGDTGAPTNVVPIVSAGEHLRVRVLPGQGQCSGRLYVWTTED